MDKVTLYSRPPSPICNQNSVLQFRHRIIRDSGRRHNPTIRRHTKPTNNLESQEASGIHQVNDGSNKDRSTGPMDSLQSESNRAEIRRRELVGRASMALSISTTMPSIINQKTNSAVAETEQPDYTITNRVYLELSKCSSTMVVGGSPTACGDGNPGEKIGRVVIGLYGKQVPETAAHFKAMCNGSAGSSYKGCLIHRVLAGQYLMAGKQGTSRERGEVPPPTKLGPNLESVKADAFKLRHSRPGTLSLCLSENDDEDQFRLSSDYRNVEFLITTGPGPAPQLDNKNIVFGTVLEGLDFVRDVATSPTYQPSERIRQFNEFASLLGDERASNARNLWYRPLKAIYISDCGEL